MVEQIRTVTMKGKPLHLVGNKVNVGDQVPKFHVVANDLSRIECTTYEGRVCIILTVPSIDTPVCEIEVKKFNEAATNLSSEICILAISMDLPFAQSRYCGAQGIDKVQTLSGS